MKTGRNDPCPCGSGKKYKKCCVAKDQAAGPPRNPETARSPGTDAAEPEWWRDLPETSEAARDRQEMSDEEERREPDGGSSSEDSELAADGSEGKEEPHPDSRAIQPRPEFTLPELAPAEQAIVDEWWKGTMPVFKEMNTAIVLERIVRFLDAQPRLFPHLYLHEDGLFELGAALRREGRPAQFTGLLKRLRAEQPQTYLACFGYYDTDIIEDLTITGPRSEIPTYFSYFKQYLDADIENCHKLMNWLAWAGYEEELMDLAQAVALPLVASPNGGGGSFAIEWMLLREYFPFFEVRDASLEAAGKIRQAHQTLLPPGDKPVTLTRIHTILKTVGQLPRGWVKDKPPKDKNTYLNDVHWDFVGYLHWEKRCGWVKAIYLAARWQEYFFRHDKAQNPFDLDAEHLENHLLSRCRRFFHLEGALALSFLQAMVHYADYLAYHQAPTPRTRDQVMESCRDLYAKAAQAVEGGDSSLRLYPRLEE